MWRTGLGSKTAKQGAGNTEYTHGAQVSAKCRTPSLKVWLSFAAHCQAPIRARGHGALFDLTHLRSPRARPEHSLHILETRLLPQQSALPRPLTVNARDYAYIPESEHVP
jgi:hypothetical protein